VVEDLGTEFEVMASGARLQVAVASGTVAIHRTGAPSVTLTAGDLASVGSEGEPTVSHRIAVDRITSWRAGTLDFDDRPLNEVTTELERWYDVSFSLGDGAGDRRFSGPIPTDRLDQAIAIVSTAFPEMAVARDGRTISIAPKRSP
jgi:transmembrane sensor